MEECMLWAWKRQKVSSMAIKRSSHRKKINRIWTAGQLRKAVTLP